MAPFTIDRPRLLRRLDERAPLTLLRAPVGFGKTTLAAQWAATASEVVVWWRPRTSDGRRFWVDALEVLADAGLTDGSTASPAAREDQFLAVERTLFRTDTPVVIILDDVEQVADVDLERELLGLVRHVRHLRLVVCLRTNRHFRDHGHLDLGTSTLTAHDLRFTPEEVAELLTVTGSVVPGTLQDELWEASGGWPEPVRALALQLRQRRPSQVGEIRSTMEAVAADYVRDRLRAPDAEGRVDLALRTSVADDFSVEMAEVLTGDPATGARLRDLETHGLLISSSRDGQEWFRWPPAARAALRRELSDRAPGLTEELQARLARWYRRAGELGLALRHAVASRDWELVVEVIESSWRGLLVEHNDELVEAFEAVPLEYLDGHPRALALRDTKLHVPDDRLIAVVTLPDTRAELLAMGRGADAEVALDTALAVLVALRARGEMALAREYGLRSLEIARAARTSHPATTQGLYATLHLQVGVTQMLAGDFSGAAHSLFEAHQKGAHHPMGYVQSDAAAKLALTHSFQGETGRAEAWLEVHHEAAPNGVPVGQSAWLLPAIRNTAAAAELLVALQQLDLGRAASAEATLIRSVRHEELWPLILHARAQHAMHTGTVEEMLRLIDSARTAYHDRMRRGAVAAPLLAATEADLHLSLGRANLAQAALDRATGAHPALRLAQARLNLLAGRTAEALQLTYDAEWETSAGQHNRLAMHLVRALAAQREGDVPAAVATLDRVLRAAAASRNWRPFLTVPRAELDELVDRTPGAGDLLATTPLVGAPSLYPDAVVIVELSEREQHVLSELAKGRSLTEIAKAAVLSDNTIRSQRRSLYRKLGTSDRGTAIARARQWGLLAADG